MNESKIGTRYAKALFSLARETGQVDEISQDMLVIKRVSEQVEEFKLLVSSPVIGVSSKTRIFRTLFKGRITDTTLAFLDLVVKNKRESFIASMTRNYIDLVRQDKGIKPAFFITPFEIDAELEKRVKGIIEAYFKTRVELITSQDPDLIGGFLIRVGDQQIDSSIKARLKQIKNSLVSTDFEIKY
jgi:F-type H+-transporting ATPase subunit delta